MDKELVSTEVVGKKKSFLSRAVSGLESASGKLLKGIEKQENKQKLFREKVDNSNTVLLLKKVGVIKKPSKAKKDKMSGKVVSKKKGFIDSMVNYGSNPLLDADSYDMKKQKIGSGVKKSKKSKKRKMSNEYEKSNFERLVGL